MEITVKLTSHAKERMASRFSRPLGKEDIAEVLHNGKMYPLHGGYYFEHQDVGIILRPRVTAPYHFYVTTVLNLKRKRSSIKLGFSHPRKSPFKDVTVF